VQPEQQELDRLHREEMAAGSIIAGVHRVLLPLRRLDERDSLQTVEASVLERLGAHAPVSVTLLHVVEKGEKRDADAYLKRIAARFPMKDVARRVVSGTDVANAILDEVHREYDLLVLGASERQENQVSPALFSPLVDTVVRLSPAPTLVVQGPPQLEAWSPERILAPAIDTPASRHAAELAFAIARPGNPSVMVLNVVEPVTSRWHDGRYEYREAASAEYEARQQGRGWQIVESLVDLGRLYDVAANAIVVEGNSPEVTILEVAETNDIDLIVLGTSLRPNSTRLFLGPRVEYILTHARCPVVVLNSV
jgi:nucleotide-binding universal stress UspA family protein